MNKSIEKALQNPRVTVIDKKTLPYFIGKNKRQDFKVKQELNDDEKGIFYKFFSGRLVPK